ncbi:AMP-binding protein [Vreelandella aquamarina]|uniref:AMP-binding protein n=1 Tax=Vreelandella aquamarina TaxID=77097 RepID=UPI00384AD0EA
MTSHPDYSHDTPMSKYADLEKTAANYSALTPIGLLQRSAHIYPDKPAVIDDDGQISYKALYRRCCQLGHALSRRGVAAGDTVAVLCPNSHEMLEAHYGIPMAGAVIVPINIRLDAATLAFILTHSEACALIYDTQWETLVQEALEQPDSPWLSSLLCVAVERDGGEHQGHAKLSYQALLEEGSADTGWRRPADEWDPISLNYTSGTTGNPKGAVYHHRGAYLAALSNAMAFDMNAGTTYLWTLPMFHCNGWGYVWAITAVGGTHVCLREIDPQQIYQRIETHGVTHLCGAPVVMNILLEDLGQRQQVLSHPTRFALGGAAPPSRVIRQADAIGFQITHLYGLTETFGPSALCVEQPAWQALSDEQRVFKMSRQGVATLGLDDISVLDMDTGEPVPADGSTLGEICVRGNTVMKGYLKNPAATAGAFAGGWFHTVDLAVTHPDGYVEVRDRAKDVIISGGENISSLEVEEVLYRHPEIREAAVVAMADDKWGEVPCAFIDPADHSALQAADVITFCRDHMANFKAPRKVVFGALPKTVTGKVRKNILRDRLIEDASRTEATPRDIDSR